MARAKYYSPRLDRDLITTLYHSARARRAPMTQLASALLGEGLTRMGAESEHGASVCERPPDYDPVRRQA